MADTTTLSVRGEAQREVAPDSAHLTVRVRFLADTKAAALSAVGAQARSVLAALERLGGAVLIAADERSDLGWVANGAVTWEEYDWVHDKRQATGRIGASVAITVAVRDFSLIEQVSTALDEHDLAHLSGVGWAVDEDNPAWAEVRAAAISAAVAKGRDYAAALGGSLVRVEHLADAGLLGAGGRESGEGVRGLGMKRTFSDDGEHTDSPPLDPSPQTIGAVIEARFAATVAPL